MPASADCLVGLHHRFVHSLSPQVRYCHLLLETIKVQPLCQTKSAHSPVRRPMLNSQFCNVVAMIVLFPHNTGHANSAFLMLFRTLPPQSRFERVSSSPTAFCKGSKWCWTSFTQHALTSRAPSCARSSQPCTRHPRSSALFSVCAPPSVEDDPPVSLSCTIRESR